MDENLVKTMMSFVTSFCVQYLFISTDFFLSLIFVILLRLDQLVFFTRRIRILALLELAMCTGIFLVSAACNTWNDTEHKWDRNHHTNYHYGSNLGLIREEYSWDFSSCGWFYGHW